MSKILRFFLFCNLGSRTFNGSDVPFVVQPTVIKAMHIIVVAITSILTTVFSLNPGFVRSRDGFHPPLVPDANQEPKCAKYFEMEQKVHDKH